MVFRRSACCSGAKAATSRRSGHAALCRRLHWPLPRPQRPYHDVQVQLRPAGVSSTYTFKSSASWIRRIAQRRRACAAWNTACRRTGAARRWRTGAARRTGTARRTGAASGGGTLCSPAYRCSSRRTVAAWPGVQALRPAWSTGAAGGQTQPQRGVQSSLIMDISPRTGSLVGRFSPTEMRRSWRSGRVAIGISCCC